MASVQELASALSIGDKLQSIYYGGQWHACRSTLELQNPASGASLCVSGAADEADVADAVAAAGAAYRVGTWSGLSGAERAVWLRKMGPALEAKRDALKTLEALNVGRPIFETDGDVSDSLSFLEYNAGAAEKLDGRQGEPVDAPEGYSITMQYEAAGVAACILPFNWPLVNVVLKLGPALAAGCTIVIKPSEYTPLTALAFAQICHEIGLPPGVVNVVTGLGHIAGVSLVKHPGVHVVGFTGSVATGPSALVSLIRTPKASPHAMAIVSQAVRSREMLSMGTRPSLSSQVRACVRTSSKPSH
jgi:betaine-aldehyde dehydrogenase